MKKFFAMPLSIAIAAILAIALPLDSGNLFAQYQPCKTGYCKPVYAQSYAPVYHAPPVVPVPPPVQVQEVHHNHVYNNVIPIGIPVPVQSYAPIAAQGKSLYTYSAASGPYPYFDPALYQQQAGKTLEEALALAKSSNADFHAAATTMRENDAAIERLRVAGEVLSRIQETPANLGTTLRETENSGFSSVSRSQFSGNQVSGNQVSGNQQTPAEEPISGYSQASSGKAYPAIDRLLSSKCATCHDKYRAGWAKLSVKERGNVFLRINHPEPAKRMPLAPDKTSPGKPLTDREKLLFLQQ